MLFVGADDALHQRMPHHITLGELADGDALGVAQRAMCFDQPRMLIARQIDLYNRVNWDETTRVGARYVDITPISRRAGRDPALMADDGLLPSGEMYRLWSDKVLPEALAALK